MHFDHFSHHCCCREAGHIADNHDFFHNLHETEVEGIHGEQFHDTVQGSQMVFFSAHPTE